MVASGFRFVIDHADHSISEVGQHVNLMDLGLISQALDEFVKWGG